jgi:hypothetical protein
MLGSEEKERLSLRKKILGYAETRWKNKKETRGKQKGRSGASENRYRKVRASDKRREKAFSAFTREEFATELNGGGERRSERGGDEGKGSPELPYLGHYLY